MNTQCQTTVQWLFQRWLDSRERLVVHALTLHNVFHYSREKNYYKRCDFDDSMNEQVINEWSNSELFYWLNHWHRWNVTRTFGTDGWSKTVIAWLTENLTVFFCELKLVAGTKSYLRPLSSAVINQSQSLQESQRQSNFVSVSRNLYETIFSFFRCIYRTDRRVSVSLTVSYAPARARIA